MSSTLRLGFFGAHLATDESAFDADLPMSSRKAALFNNNAGHLHDACMPYRVNMYGLGLSIAGAAGEGRYLRSIPFPITRCAGGTPAHLDCRVLVGTETGTASTVMRIVPIDAPYPATDDMAIAVFDGSNTTTEGAWVIDESKFCDPTKRLTKTAWPVLHGDGTLRGTGGVWLVRADIDVTVTGATGGSLDWFGVAAVQIREHVYTP